MFWFFVNIRALLARNKECVGKKIDEIIPRSIAGLPASFDSADASCRLDDILGDLDLSPLRFRGSHCHGLFPNG